MGSAAPLLRTKLHRPPVTTDLVRRERLHERLSQGLEIPLTLVSAPAGYGKSMLVSSWAESIEQPCAWLSLDETDSETTEFLTYVIAAIRTVEPTACTETEELLTAPVLPPVHVLADCLTNELDDMEPTLVLVLDDYQRIAASSSVHELLGRVLEHPPHPLRFVLLTRRDPPLPLVGLRARNLVTEVTLDDLRFAKAEAASFLLAITGLAASDEALANLQVEVEGWAVGLRLVSLAMRNAEDPESFLKGLHGGLPQTQDYLLHEVLDAQPAPVRETLLRSSILNRFSAEVLDAICAPKVEAEGSGLSGVVLIELLQQSNLFAIPLDAQGKWFRYHHLFQDLLRRQLQQRSGPAEITALHLRASEWFESAGLVSEAIEHSLSAEDVVLAAELVERHSFDELSAERWNVVERWLDKVPAEIKTVRPQLLLIEAWIANARMQLNRVAALVEQTESLLQDEKATPTQLGELAHFHGVLHYWAGEAEAAERSLSEAVSLLELDRPFFGFTAELMRGLARYMAGKKASALSVLRERLETVQAQDGQLRAYLLGPLVFIHLLAGDLTEARLEAERLQHVARKNHLPNAEGWGSYLEACAQLHAHQLESAVNAFVGAAAHRYVLETRAAVDALAGLALTHQLMGRHERASDALDVVQEFAHETNDALTLSVAHSARARVALLRGDLPSALDWAQSLRETSLPMELFLWLEVPSITRARVLIAVGSEQSLAQATELLEELRKGSDALRLIAQTIEIAVLQLLALQRQGRAEEALASLRETLALAVPRGWVRPFVEAGPAMVGILRRLDSSGEEAIFVRQILDALERPVVAPTSQEVPIAEKTTARASQPLSRLDQQAVDSLTNREIDVLELLTQRLQNKEIASRLCISPHTVNDHTRRIYDKLSVHGRRQAVKRAVELGVIDPGSGRS